jgi:apolipoprotein N-acyltransferase
VALTGTDGEAGGAATAPAAHATPSPRGPGTPTSQAGHPLASQTGNTPPSLTGPAPLSQAGPAPLSQAGPAPLSQAGPAPLSQAGPAPPSQAGPAPLSQAGPAPLSQAGPAPPSQAVGLAEGAPGGRGLAPGLPLRWALLTALAGGLALAAAFPPAGVWPLAPLGPALLVVGLWRRRAGGAFAVGVVFGLAFFVPLLSWLINVAWYAWAALAAAETLIFAALVLGQRLMLRLRGWPLAVACWWVAAEALRGRWPYAFPWGRLAMSQAGAPTAGWAGVGGAPLLSLLVALAGTTLAWLLLGTGHVGLRSGGTWPRRLLRGRVVPGLCFIAAAGLALAGGLLPVDPVPAGTPAAVVAAVQGDVPHARNLPDLLRATTVTANHAAATKALAAQVRTGRRAAPALVIWPENATDLDPHLYPAVYAQIASAVRAIGAPLLAGEVLQNPQRNAGQLWTPRGGPGPVYVKRQLVPFGEYIPFRGLLAHITALVALQPHDFTPGHRAVVFHIGRIALGDVICYEVGFDGLVSSEVSAGANLLAMQTNDATFEVDGQLGESLQQLAMARIRAVETDRAVVVASTTGVSAIIAPDGRLLAHTRTWRRTVLEGRVPLVSYRTLADRAGGWPEALIVALALAALAWAAAGALRRRTSRTAGRP